MQARCISRSERRHANRCKQLHTGYRARRQRFATTFTSDLVFKGAKSLQPPLVAQAGSTGARSEVRYKPTGQPTKQKLWNCLDRNCSSSRKQTPRDSRCYKYCKSRRKQPLRISMRG